MAEVRASQLIVLVEIDQVMVRVSQLVVLVEIEISASPDYPKAEPGGVKRLTGRQQPGQRTTAPGATPRQAKSRSPRIMPVSGAEPPAAAPTLAATLDGAPVAPAALAAAVASDYDGSSANDYTVELQTAAGAAVFLPKLNLRAIGYSGATLGGSQQADVSVAGPFPELWGVLDWLGYRIIIRNGYGWRVWAGVVETATVSQGRLQVTLSLRDMYNKVASQYTRSNAADDAESPVTAWATDAASVAAFGTKELRIGLGESTPAQAEQQRDTALAQMKDPIAGITLGATEVQATLNCIGVWYLLDWVYYINDDGYVKNEADDGIDQPIGFSLTDDKIGFYADGLHDIDLQLGALRAGQWLLVTGSSSSDGAYQVASAATPETRVEVTSTAISFDADDDLYGPWFDALIAGELIQVAGSDDNDGYYRVKRVEADNLVIVTPKTLTTEGAGDTVIVTQGHHLTVENGDWEYDGPGATVTVKSYAKLAQAFQPAAGSWAAQEVVLQVRIEGTVTDTLRVSIYNDSSGSPGTQQATATLAAADVSDAFRWHSVTLDVPVTATAGTNLWLVVERTGAVAADNYWAVAMGATDAGAAKGWNGSSWVSHAGAVSLLFQVWATVDTATAASNMLTASEFVDSVEIKQTTGVKTRLYRDGTRRIREELEALASSGDTNDQRLRVVITPDRVGVVEVEYADTGDLRIDANGDLRIIPGDGLLGPGILPLARWVTLADLPALNHLPRAVYIEAAQFDVETGELTLTPRGYTAAWEG